MNLSGQSPSAAATTTRRRRSPAGFHCRFCQLSDRKQGASGKRCGIFKRHCGQPDQLQVVFIGYKVLSDPKGGNTAYHKAIEQKIEQLHTEINELRSKGEAFLNEVIDYYQRKK